MPRLFYLDLTIGDFFSKLQNMLPLILSTTFKIYYDVNIVMLIPLLHFVTFVEHICVTPVRKDIAQIHLKNIKWWHSKTVATLNVSLNVHNTLQYRIVYLIRST